MHRYSAAAGADFFEEQGCRHTKHAQKGKQTKDIVSGTKTNPIAKPLAICYPRGSTNSRFNGDSRVVMVQWSIRTRSVSRSFSERTVGAALRGRPAWNSISRHPNIPTVRLALDSISRITPAAKNGIPRRAATEGRPYSTFDGVN